MTKEKTEKVVSFEIGKDGVLRTSYNDELSKFTEKIGGEMTQVCRASNVEWERIESSGNARFPGPAEGWAVRSAHNPKLALRIQSNHMPLGILGDPYVDTIVCSDQEDLAIALFEKREIAVKNELEHFFELIPRKAGE